MSGDGYCCLAFRRPRGSCLSFVTFADGDVCVCVEGGGWGAYFHVEAIWARSAVNSLVFEQFSLE